MALIDSKKSIEENYSRLLQLERILLLEDMAGDSYCAWCHCQAKEHLPDKRCSTYATSQYFTNRDIAKRNSIGKALELIESLRKIEASAATTERSKQE